METNEMKSTPECPKTWMVESILVTILCCLPLGIVGIVNAAKVNSLYSAGSKSQQRSREMDQNRCRHRSDRHRPLHYLRRHRRSRLGIMRIRKGIAGVILLLCAAVVFYTYNPESTTFFPRCPFLVLTGLKCPGCGSQRAIHALLHADLPAAFHYNALLVLSLPIIFLLLYAEAVRRKKPAFYARIQRPAYIWIYFAITLVWMAARNVFGW